MRAALPKWYLLRKEEEFLIRSLTSDRTAAIRAALLEGAPGSGKTSLAKALAEGLGGAFLYHLLHSWSDDAELFTGIDVAAVVSGDATRVRQPGVLALAAQLANQAVAESRPPVVVCLDEVDKVQERVEYLLLDFLETGRVPVRPGEQLQADPTGMIVILTSNGTRALSEALLRRVRRCRIRSLTNDEILSIVGDDLVARLTLRAFRAAEAANGCPLSLAELRRALEDIRLCESMAECEVALRQNFDRYGLWTPERQMLEPLWGAVRRAKSEGRWG